MSQPPLIFSGNSDPQLAEEIAKRLKLHVGKALVGEFKNAETRVEIGENVRGSEVFVVQSICKTPGGKSVNDALMELLLMIDALRRASAARITSVIPYYGYAKQDKKTKGREPISAKVVANLLKVTGTRRIVTMDLHAAQIQGFFDIPVNNLMATPVLCNYLKKEGLCDDKIVVVSPDAGGVHRAEIFAKRLGSSLANRLQAPPRTGHFGGYRHRRRRFRKDCGHSERHDLDRWNTREGCRSDSRARCDPRLYRRVARYLRRRRGQRAGTLRASKRCIVTNTIPLEHVERHPKFVQLSIAQTFADAINRITTNRSVSELFTGDEPPKLGPSALLAEPAAVS